MSGSSSATEILDQLSDLGRQRARVSIGDVAEVARHRGIGFFILVPALLELSPIGAIPGVPTALAGFVALISVQLVLGRNHLWLPSWIERRSLGGTRLSGALGKLRPVGRFLDRWFHGRLEWATRGPAIRFAAGACIVLCLTVPPLELIPFASSVPMAAIALFGLAFMVQDGLLFLVAWSASALALGAGGYFWLGG